MVAQNAVTRVQGLQSWALALGPRVGTSTGAGHATNYAARSLACWAQVYCPSGGTSVQVQAQGVQRPQVRAQASAATIQTE